MNNIYKKSICSLVFFKTFRILKIVRMFLEKRSTIRSSSSQMFYKKDIFETFAEFTRKRQFWDLLLIKSLQIKRLQQRCFPVNFAKNFHGTPPSD